MFRSLRCFSLFFIGITFLLPSVVLAQAEISSKLEYELSTTREQIPVYVILTSQANAKQILANESARGLSKQAQVAEALTQVKLRNQQTQRPLVQRLSVLEDVVNVRSRWIVNLVGFSASPEKIREIATYPEVAAIYYDEPWEVEQVLEESMAMTVPGGVEPGIRAVNADKMWALGYTGFGGVAFTADTGVDPFHPALNYKYAGYEGRTGAWYDFTGRTEFPFDCGDHGTHVSGTILGVDRIAEDTIGVAYNAHWLGGAILCGVGTADNIGAFEWAIDPDGDFETTDDRPVVINNSWRDPSIADEECTNTNPYPVILDNLEAAGIAVVFSAGNSGPDASTITPPHNYNAGLVNAFTVGALNQISTGIAEFSSRGPALCIRDSVQLDIKPEVSAPGQNVRSCLPEGGYGFKSGTSMAAPHVAGAILLLNEAFPSLDGETLKLALYHSAVDMGEPGEDNTFGMGIIDVFAAYNYLIDEGNTPVAPSWPSTAPMLMGVNAPGLSCNGELSFDLTVGNEGTEEITELSFEYVVDGVVASETRDNLTLMPGEQESIAISGTTSVTGKQLLQVRLTTANGEAVDTRLDIGGSVNIELTQIAPSSLVMDDFGAEGPCLNSPIVLSLEGTTGDSLFYYFNTSENFGVGSLTSSQPFIIEELTTPTTLYGVGEYLLTGGFETPDVSEVNFIALDDEQMVLTANSSVRLRKANVVSEESGRILIVTENLNTGERVGRRSASVDAGVNSVDLLAPLEEGETYVITVSGNTDLGELPSERLRGTSMAGGRIDVINAARSFVLFDIEIGYQDGCAPIEVVLTPDSTRTSAATLEAVAIPAVVELGAQVVFSETSSTPITDHKWLIDGVSYTGTGDMISLTTSKLGTMAARILANDENNCLATAVTEAEVVEGSSNTEDLQAASTLEVFPNPTTSYFELRGNTNGLAQVSLIDALGRIIQQWSGGQQQRYELVDVAKGAYMLQLSSSDGKSTSLPFIVE